MRARNAVCVGVLGMLLVCGIAAAQDGDPQVIRDEASEEVRRAYDALRGHDTSEAVQALRQAIALMHQLAAAEMAIEEVGGGGPGVMRERDPVQAQLAFILATSQAEAATGESLGEAFGPEYERDLKAEELKQLEEEAEQLEQQQEQLAEDIKELEEQAEELGEPGQQEDGEEEAGEEQAGEEQAGEEQAGEEQAGEEQAGEEHAGEEEAGEEQAGEEHAGEEAGDEQGAEDDPHAQGEPEGGEGEEDGDPEEGDEAARQQLQEAAAEAAQDQAELAQNAAEMADKIREIAPDQSTSQEAADQFLQAAAEARTAAAKLNDQDFAAAYGAAQRTQTVLAMAVASLKGMSAEEVNFLVDRILATLENVVEGQADIRARTVEMAKIPDEDGVPAASVVRDIRLVAPRQDGLRRAMETVEFDLSVLQKWAESEAGFETKQSLVEASDLARRGRVTRKMTNAVVAYSEFDLRGASREQKSVERALRRVVEKVQDAYSSMASDPLSELKAAEIEARRIKETLGALAPESQTAEAAVLTAEDRAATGRRTAAIVGRLSRRVRSRDFEVPQGDMKMLVDVARSRSAGLEQLAAKRDPQLSTLRDSAGRVHAKLLADYEESANANMLFQAQREECPPQYRSLVNSYFEALSKMEP